MHDIRQGTCPLCGHNEVIEAEPLVSADGDRRVHLTWGSPASAKGYLRSYTCRSCGYTQMFAESPRDIAIRPELSTRLITGPAGGGPFR